MRRLALLDDPGWLRAAFAAKTTGAAGVCALALATAPQAQRLLAALAAALLVQCMAGRTRAHQERTMIVAGVVMAALSAIAIALHPHPHVYDAYVVLVAFLVFPARALLPERPMFPVFAFTMVLLANVFATALTPRGCVFAVLGGLVVAFGVQFVLLPKRVAPVLEGERRLLWAHAADFCEALARGDGDAADRAQSAMNDTLTYSHAIAGLPALADREPEPIDWLALQEDTVRALGDHAHEKPDELAATFRRLAEHEPDAWTTARTLAEALEGVDVERRSVGPLVRSPAVALKEYGVMGLRGAVAVALAMAVGQVLHLQRAYWIELAAVVLLAETWRESAQKGFARVAMTALGCAAGVALHVAVGGNVALGIIVLYGAVFLAVFMRPASYPWMIFFLTIYVVFLFALLGRWTTSIAIARVVDTLVGAGIAVVVGLPFRRIFLGKREGELRIAEPRESSS